MSHSLKLSRAHKLLKRHLQHGWERAVFSAPQKEQDDAQAEPPQEAMLLQGPAPGPVSEQDFQALFARAQQAAQQGLVKLCFVLHDQSKVIVDARHGRVKQQKLDEARIKKMMGGKERPLRPDRSSELLRVIGIMNADGSISAKNAKKYKQVNHLVTLCRPSWERAQSARKNSEQDSPLRILDLGCGNGYLGFVLSEALRLEKIPHHLHGIDLRSELIDHCQERASVLGLDNTSFEQARIEEGLESALKHMGGAPDLVLSLHACDTATDEALALAISSGAASIFCVPCCQAQLAAQMEATPPSVMDANPMQTWLEHGLFRRSYCDLLSDALRVQMLEACGYSVQVVEFVSHEHTAKNTLLRAHRRHHGQADPSRWDLRAIEARCQQLAIKPTLLSTLLALQRPT